MPGGTESGRTHRWAYLSGRISVLSLFEVSFAWNRLEEASDWLQRLQRIAQDWQQVELLVRGEIRQDGLRLQEGISLPHNKPCNSSKPCLSRRGLPTMLPG